MKEFDLRVAKITAYAEKVFGEKEKAHAWLNRPNRALEGRLPLDLLATDAGSKKLEEILRRIEHGIYG